MTPLLNSRRIKHMSAKSPCTSEFSCHQTSLTSKSIKMLLPKTVSTKQSVEEGSYHQTDSNPTFCVVEPNEGNTDSNDWDSIRLDQADDRFPKNTSCCGKSILDAHLTTTPSPKLAMEPHDPRNVKTTPSTCESEPTESKLKKINFRQLSDEAKRSNRILCRGADEEEAFDPARRQWGPPGASFVPWGPLGPPDRSYSGHSSTQQETTRSNDDLETQSECDSKSWWNPKDTRRRRPCIVLAAMCFVLAAVTVGIGITVIAKTSNKATSNGLTMMAAPSTSCDFWFHHDQPNVITQCFCTGAITIIADDVAAHYHNLVEGGFIKELLPDFGSAMDSCDPTNQALVWLASGTGTPSQDANARQRYILALLYLFWNGQWWTADQNWFSALDECSWLGVACDASGQVVKIGLDNISIRGSLRSEISLLPSLTSLSLSQNSLNGTLPTELVGLTGLRELALNGNILSGNIPSDYGNLSLLTSLVISNNHLNGSLPSDLGLLNGLDYLLLSNNKITGTIPTELGMLQSLQAIALDNNTISGFLPTEIGLWRKIKLVDFSFNNLNGSTIPTEIGMLSMLTSLTIVASGIQGTIPVELFGISGIVNIQVTANKLNGTIPAEIGQLTALNLLNVGENILTGSIPSTIGMCSSLSQVFVDGNLLNGTIPSELGLLQLATLDLIGDMFTGTVPMEVCAIMTPLFCSTNSKLKCNCCSCP